MKDYHERTKDAIKQRVTPDALDTNTVSSATDMTPPAAAEPEQATCPQCNAPYDCTEPGEPSAHDYPGAPDRHYFACGHSVFQRGDGAWAEVNADLAPHCHPDRDPSTMTNAEIAAELRAHVVEPEQATNSTPVRTATPERVTPHIHDPAGLGEYCTGCFDQGAVWAMYEERARIRRIVERKRNHLNMVGDRAGRPQYAVKVLDDLLAAIDGGPTDA